MRLPPEPDRRVEDAASESSSLDSAEAVYLQFLTTARTPTAFEELCVEHPNLDAALRRMHQDFERAQRALAPDHPGTASANDQLAAVVADLEPIPPAMAYQMATPLARSEHTTLERVWDVRLRRPVIRKTLRIDVRNEVRAAAEGELLQQFVAEISGLSRLQHPGIPAVHDAGIDDRGMPFFTMREVRGDAIDTLAGPIVASEPAARERAVRAMAQACEAIAFAHDRGVVHGTLQPSDLRVGRFGEVVVLGWGHANFAADAAITDGRALDQRALGAILFQVLTGRQLAGLDRGARATLLAHSRVPAELGAICARAGAAGTPAGYGSVGELGRDLWAYLERRIVEAHSSGLLARARSFGRRNPVLAAAIAVLLLSLVGGSIGAIATRAARRVELQEARDELAGQQALAATRLAELQARAYANDLGIAQAILLHNQNMGQVRPLLDRWASTDPALEWRLLDVLADQSVRSVTVASADYVWLDVSADGAALLIGTDNQLRCLATDSGKTIFAARAPTSVCGIAQSPTRRYVAASHKDNVVRIYDGGTGALLGKAPRHGDWTRVAFAADDLLVSCGNNDLVRIWHAPHLALVREFPSRVGVSITLTVNRAGTLVAMTDYNRRVVVHDLATGKCVYEGGQADGIPEFSPDGLEVWALGARSLQRVVLSSRTAVTTLLPTAGHSQGETRADSGKHIARCVGSSIAVLDRESLQQTTMLHGHGARLYMTAMHPNGRWLYSSDSSGIVKFWDLHRPVARVAGGPDGAITTLACSRDGRAIAALTNTKALWVFDLTQPGPPRQCDCGPGALDTFAWADDANGKPVLVVTKADGTMYCVGPKGETRAQAALAPSTGPTDPRRSLTADGKRAIEVRSDRDRELLIVDPSSGEVLVALDLPTAGRCVALSADDRVIAVGLADGRVAVWAMHR